MSTLSLRINETKSLTFKPEVATIPVTPPTTPGTPAPAPKAATATIFTRAGKPIAFTDLKVGDSASVEGFVFGSSIAANEVDVAVTGPPSPTATLGTISAVASPNFTLKTSTGDLGVSCTLTGTTTGGGTPPPHPTNIAYKFSNCNHLKIAQSGTNNSIVTVTANAVNPTPDKPATITGTDPQTGAVGVLTVSVIVPAADFV